VSTDLARRPDPTRPRPPTVPAMPSASRRRWGGMGWKVWGS